MKSSALLALPVVFLLGAGAPDDSTTKDLKHLQGTWTIVSVQERGKKETTPVGDSVVFSGNKVTFSIGGDKDTTDFKLNAAKKPRWFDITGGDYKSVGIYELEGDTLKVALNQSGPDRPSAFKSEKDSPHERLFVLKRAK